MATEIEKKRRLWIVVVPTPLVGGPLKAKPSMVEGNFIQQPNKSHRRNSKSTTKSDTVLLIVRTGNF